MYKVSCVVISIVGFTAHTTAKNKTKQKQKNLSITKKVFYYLLLTFTFCCLWFASAFCLVLLFMFLILSDSVVVSANTALNTQGTIENCCSFS